MYSMYVCMYVCTYIHTDRHTVRSEDDDVIVSRVQRSSHLFSFGRPAPLISILREI